MTFENQFPFNGLTATAKKSAIYYFYFFSFNESRTMDVNF